jgi:hypothetical protein
MRTQSRNALGRCLNDVGAESGATVYQSLCAISNFLFDSYLLDMPLKLLAPRQGLVLDLLCIVYELIKDRCRI